MRGGAYEHGYLCLVGEGMLEEAGEELGLEHALYGGVELRERQGAVRHGGDECGEADGLRDFHVDAGAEGEQAGGGVIGSHVMAGVELAHGEVIGDDEALEAERAAQDVTQQMGIGMGGNAAAGLVVGGEHGTDVRDANGLLKGVEEDRSAWCARRSRWGRRLCRFRAVHGRSVWPWR